MNEVRKAVTNDDISDQENARFLFGGGFVEVRSAKAVLPQFGFHKKMATEPQHGCGCEGRGAFPAMGEAA
jgi:hypothetical protein